MFSFTLIGHFVSETDVAVGAASYDSTTPYPLIGIQTRIDVVTLSAVKSITLDLNNEIKIPTDMNAANGFGEVNLGKRSVSGVLVQEDTLLVTYDFRSIMESGQLVDIQRDSVGVSSGNLFGWILSKAFFVNDPEGENENRVTREMQYEGVPEVGVDDVKLLYT